MPEQGCKMSNYSRSIKDINYRFDKFINIDNQDLLNLSSNDYLGLSTKKDLVDEFLATGKNYFFSSASARLLSGTETIYKDLEILIAQIFNKEKALLYNTGYQCNLGVISALNCKGDVVFSDKLNHASIIDGMRLSDGNFFRYRHLDYDNLEELLKKHRGSFKNAIIVSESVFSMDGDCADIKRLVELKEKYNCLLMIDEAHAFMAVDDDFGGGLSKGYDVDIITATFGKALASFGAFVVSSEEVVIKLINKSRSFIFSTAIPPVNVAWTYWLLADKADLIMKQKSKLFKNICDVHSYMSKAGIKTSSLTQIIPIVLHETERTELVSERLQGLGYFVLPIRPPTVPEGGARIRVSLTAETTLEDIIPLLDNVADELQLAK